MRTAARRLQDCERLERDVFPRGCPEGLVVDRPRRWTCSWFALLQARARVLARQPDLSHLSVEATVCSPDQL